MDSEIQRIADRDQTDKKRFLQVRTLSYIIPLHRNNSLIDFSPLQRPNFKKEMQYFIFRDRII
jgi:hypothetical protein